MQPLDPGRTYTAVEVQAYLDRRELTDLRVDLTAVMELARQTAEDLHKLELIVQSLVSADQELGVNAMSSHERAALPAAVRAYLAGQASGRRHEHAWRRLAGIAVAVGGLLGMLSFLGLDSWIRIHWLGLPP